MATPYSEALREKLAYLLKERRSSATIEDTVEVLEADFVGPYLYQIVWTDQVPTSLKPVFCDYFKQSGVNTYIALREGKYVTALCYHQFVDCRQDVHRERQLEKVLGYE
jgi:hypothetical protein